MPGLAVALSLQMSSYPRGGITRTSSDDVVSFISSLLLGSDQTVRNWFAQFVKAAQKVSEGVGVERGTGWPQLAKLHKRSVRVWAWRGEQGGRNWQSCTQGQ